MIRIISSLRHRPDTESEPRNIAVQYAQRMRELFTDVIQRARDRIQDLPRSVVGGS